MRRFLCMIALLLASPGRASAWANAQISTAGAEVDVAADGSVQVAMNLSVRVIGGWLSELEVAGLDRGLLLSEAVPATFARASGGPVPFSIASDATGRVAFSFPRNAGPRAGDYVARFAYTASIAEGGIGPGEGDRVRYAWTFPAWATGLDAVVVTLRAPAGSTLERTDEESLTGVTVESVQDGSGERFVLRRLFLPRSIPWTVAFSLPRASVPAALRPAVEAPAPRAVVATSRDGRPQPSTRLVCIVFGVVAVLKHLAFARRARRRGAEPRPLLPFRSPLVVVPMVLAACIGAALSWSHAPEAAFACLGFVVLLVAQRPARRTRASRLGSFRSSSAPELRAARWSSFVDSLEPASLLDATRPLGFVVAALVVAGLAWLHLREPADSSDAVFSVPHALALLFLLFCVATISMIPMSVDERLEKLADVARGLRMPTDAGRLFGFRLAVHRDAHDHAQDARLRMFSEQRARGLVRLDVALVERATLGGYVSTPVLLVVVRQGSEAERILARALPSQSVKAAPGGRRARVLPLRPSTWAVADRLAHSEEAESDRMPTRPRAGLETVGEARALL